MEVSGVDAEVEAEMMTADTPVAEEIALTTEAGEMEIIIEEAVALAHALEAHIETHGAHEGTAAIVTIYIPGQETIVEAEMKGAEQVEVRKERVHLH